MITDTGNALLILAFLLAVLQALPFARHTRSVTLATSACITLAFLVLVLAFVISDFSVNAVFRYSHTLKPLIYKISGTWGNHEGSMLLWAVILSGYSALFSLISRVPSSIKEVALRIQGMITAALLAFILLTSNPFIRLWPVPEEGQGLNPLLQDWGLALHPPMLYLGYVGFSLAFSLAIAGLKEGGINRSWAGYIRPWARFSWAALTLGIGLGSWWAYRELGWGGFWFWDPVENASLMPWLVATALLHSLDISTKQGGLLRWTALLALLTFILSLLGTFLVRSGVLTSVHAFANDPARGIFILAMIAVAIVAALWQFARYAPAVAEGKAFEPVSREAVVLWNNVLFMVMLATVVLGTLYPLLLDHLTGQKVSVGAPYFSQSVAPVATLVLALMVFAPALAFRRDKMLRVLKRFAFALLLGVVLAGFILMKEGGAHWVSALLMGAGVSVLLGTAYQAWQKEKALGLRAVPKPFYAMVLAHLGIGLMGFSIGAATLFQQEANVILSPGESHTLGNYRFTLETIHHTLGKNYLAREGVITVSDIAGQRQAVLYPESRFYPVEAQQTTEAAVHYGVIYNLYAALGESDGKGHFMLRFYVQPMMNGIALGAVLMVLGGMIAVFERQKGK